jgi:hypothetical protein
LGQSATDNSAAAGSFIAVVSAAAGSYIAVVWSLCTYSNKQGQFYPEEFAVSLYYNYLYITLAQLQLLIFLLIINNDWRRSCANAIVMRCINNIKQPTKNKNNPKS